MDQCKNNFTVELSWCLHWNYYTNIFIIPDDIIIIKYYLFTTETGLILWESGVKKSGVVSFNAIRTTCSFPYELFWVIWGLIAIYSIIKNIFSSNNVINYEYRYLQFFIVNKLTLFILCRICILFMIGTR